MVLPVHTLQKTSITLRMLIDAGILDIGQEIFCYKPNIKGVLNNDGSITVSIGNENKNFEYLSGAARHIEKRSLNGWLYWHIRTGDEKRALGNFRDDYLNLGRNIK